MIWKVHTRTCLILDMNVSASLQYGHADYGFEYSDEEVEEEDVDIENQYYNSKGRAYRQFFGKIASSMQTISKNIYFAGLLESSDQTEALQGFQEVVKMEPDKAEW